MCGRGGTWRVHGGYMKGQGVEGYMRREGGGGLMGEAYGGPGGVEEK